MSDTPCLIDLQLALPTLPADLAPPQPQLALELLLPMLAAELAPPAPLLDLVPRLPEAIDAALIPILVGPPGPAGGGADLINPVLTWAGGRLVGVAYDGGASKALVYSSDQLATLDLLRPGQPTLRKTFSYNPDGTLAAVTQAEV